MSIKFKVLGEFTLYQQGEAVSLPKSKRTRALLAYLAITDRPHRRERLCEVFWDLPEDPRGSLRWSLSKIRPYVNAPDYERLEADRERVTLLTSDIQIDISEIKENLEANELSVEQLFTFLKQLEEPLLDGIDLPNQDTFQQWLISERLETERLSLRVLMLLSQHPDLTPGEQLHWMKQTLERSPYDTQIATRLLKQLDLLGHSSERENLSAELVDRFQNAGLEWNPASIEGKKEDIDLKAELVADREMLVRQQVKFCTTTDDVRIAYASVGSGYPIIKSANWLSHLEYDWNAPIWSPLFRALARDHHFIRYDERGNGLSDWEVKDISFNAFVEDLETVVATTQLDKFALLGISQGASVSIEYAIKYPEKVSQLILFGGYAAGWRIGASEQQIQEREAIMTLTEVGWGQDNPAYRQIFSSTFMPSANKEELDWFNEFQRLTTSPENAVRFLSVFGDIDVLHQLAKVKVPTLVIHSLGDQRIPVETGKEIASSIPNAEFVGLESDNHLLLGREPASQIFIDTVRDFITRTNQN